MSEPVTETVVIQGRTLKFPIEVRRAQQWLATYAVPARAASALIPPGLEVAPVPGGKAILSLAFVRYIDGDLDAYNEVGVILLVRHRGERGVYVRHLPVNQTFTLEAGRTIWGYPKFPASIDIDDDGRRTSCTLRDGDAHVLTLTVRNGGVPMPAPKAPPTFTSLDGILRRTEWSAALGGVRGRLGGASVTLGTHPIAEELRSLGLPKRPMFSSSVRNFRARFGPAEVINARDSLAQENRDRAANT